MNVFRIKYLPKKINNVLGTQIPPPQISPKHRLGPHIVHSLHILIHKEYALKYPLVKLQELLENFLLSKMHLFINSQSTIIFWIILLKQSLVSILGKRSKTMFKRGRQKLV